MGIFSRREQPSMEQEPGLDPAKQEALEEVGKFFPGGEVDEKIALDYLYRTYRLAVEKKNANRATISANTLALLEDTIAKCRKYITALGGNTEEALYGKERPS